MVFGLATIFEWCTITNYLLITWLYTLIFTQSENWNPYKSIACDVPTLIKKNVHVFHVDEIMYTKNICLTTWPLQINLLTSWKAIHYLCMWYTNSNEKHYCVFVSDHCAMQLCLLNQYCLPFQWLKTNTHY